MGTKARSKVWCAR
jgi:hypothetical protein